MCTNDDSNQANANNDAAAPPGTTPDAGTGGAPSSAGGDAGSGSGDSNAGLLNGDGLTTGQNDAVGVALGYAGMIPGPVGTAATLAGLGQTAATAPSDPTDPNYQNDQMVTGLNAGLGVASLLGMEAAGPLGLVAAGGMALGHGAQAVGNEMIEQGMQNNPENFGPDPFDSLTAGQQGY
jgi:hypothetical protein